MLFKLIAVCGVLLFFLIIEIMVRQLVPTTKKNERLVDLGELTFFSKITIKGEPVIRITSKYGYSEQQTTFNEKKSPDTYRVFCLGGSAVAGWPHPANERFSAYLDTCLKKIYPDRRIEIINCGAHGFASYRVREVFHQLVSFEPDAVIVWSGNNEFLEDQRFKITKIQSAINAMAKHIKTVQFVQNILPKSELNGNEIDVANSFWKKAQQQSLELCSDSVLALKVRQVYHESIQEITDEARQNKIKVLLFTVPVNLRDWQPNVSYYSLKKHDSIDWAESYNLGRNALNKGEFETANIYLKKAVSKEPIHGMSHFLLARSFEMLKDTVSALQSYVRAKDLDFNPFRAVTDFNESIREIAANDPNVSLFDAEKLFQKYGSRGIPGFDLFLDYVHPTRDGNLILASELGDFIRQKNLFGFGNSEIKVDTTSLRSLLSDYCDENDITVQVTCYSLCCLTHQYGSAVSFGNKILENLPAAYLENPLNQNDINKLRDGVKCFAQLLEVEKQVLNGVAKNQDLTSAKAAMHKFYETYYPYGTY